MTNLLYTYRVVHRLPNGDELELASVETRREAEYVTETAQYEGIWLTPDLKLLRYGLGLLEVREEKQPVAIVNEEVIRVTDTVQIKLELANHETIGWLLMTDEVIYAYDHKFEKQLWEAASFATLAFRINKDVAYKCSLLYDANIEQGIL